MKRPGEVIVGSHTIRILKQKDGFAGIVVGQSENRVAGKTEAEVEIKLRDQIDKANPRFIGLDGARKRFLQLFPEAFRDPHFIGDLKHGERTYKIEAATFLQRELPLGDIHDATEVGAKALRAIQKTNLIDPYTKAKLGDVLRSERGRDFVLINAIFAEGNIAEACRRLNSEFKDVDINRWVCLTYLPFMWRPDRHVFLKPTFTRAFAERIGHRFQHDYSSSPNSATYASLLHMMALIGHHLEDLAPADNIDLHSFMWAVMDYNESDAGPPTE